MRGESVGSGSSGGGGERGESPSGGACLLRGLLACEGICDMCVEGGEEHVAGGGGAEQCGAVVARAVRGLERRGRGLRSGRRVCRGAGGVRALWRRRMGNGWRGCQRAGPSCACRGVVTQFGRNSRIWGRSLSRTRFSGCYGDSAHLLALWRDPCGLLPLALALGGRGALAGS